MNAINHVMAAGKLKTITSNVEISPVNPDARDPLKFLTFRISRLHLALDAQAVAILKKTAGIGLGQWRVLSMVGSHGSMTSREIHHRTTLDPAFISRTLRSLEDDNFVKVSRRDNDRRLLMVQLTAKGKQVFKRTLPTMQKRQASLLSSLTATENRVLLKAISKLEFAARDHSIPAE